MIRTRMTLPAAALAALTLATAPAPAYAEDCWDQRQSCIESLEKTLECDARYVRCLADALAAF